jgi:hypothetical protein
MPVRGTTAWAHAITMKKVINHDRGGTHVMCAWDTCEKDGYEAYKCVELVGREPVMWHGHIHYIERTITYVFCSERHKQYFLHSTIRANDLPAGYKRAIV